MKQEILKRVWFVYYMHKYSQPLYVRYFIIMAVFGTLNFFVSVKNVIANVSHVEVGSLYSFFASAFLQTQLVVQLLCGLAVIVGFFIIRDFVRQLGVARLSLKRE